MTHILLKLEIISEHKLHIVLLHEALRVLCKCIDRVVGVTAIPKVDTIGISPRIDLLGARDGSVLLEVSYMPFPLASIVVPGVVRIDHKTINWSETKSPGDPQVVDLPECLSALLKYRDGVCVTTLTSIVSVRMVDRHKGTEVALESTGVVGET